MAQKFINFDEAYYRERMRLLGWTSVDADVVCWLLEHSRPIERGAGRRRAEASYRKIAQQLRRAHRSVQKCAARLAERGMVEILAQEVRTRPTIWEIDTAKLRSLETPTERLSHDGRSGRVATSGDQPRVRVTRDLSISRALPCSVSVSALSIRMLAHYGARQGDSPEPIDPARWFLPWCTKTGLQGDDLAPVVDCGDVRCLLRLYLAAVETGRLDHCEDVLLSFCAAAHHCAHSKHGKNPMRMLSARVGRSRRVDTRNIGRPSWEFASACLRAALLRHNAIEAELSQLKEAIR